MKPIIHFFSSLFIVLITWFFSETVYPLSLIFFAISIGVLIDVDHVFWAGIYKPAKIVEMILKYNIHNMWVFLNTGEYLEELTVSKTMKAIIYLLWHGYSIYFILVLSPLLFGMYNIYIINCLVGHYILDFIGCLYHLMI